MRQVKLSKAPHSRHTGCQVALAASQRPQT
jgi:hypothetical protein